MNESFGMALWMKSRSMSLSAFVCVWGWIAMQQIVSEQKEKNDDVKR